MEPHAESEDLYAKLQQCEPDIQAYVAALKKELSRLQKANISLEVANVSKDERIKIFEAHAVTDFQISNMTDKDIEELIVPLTIKVIKETGGIDAFCKKYEIDREYVGE